MTISAGHLIVRQLNPCGVRHGEDVRETETIDRATMSLSTVVGAADCAGTDGRFVDITTGETA